MYPPEQVEKITEWLERLLLSLERAGLEFHPDIYLDDSQEEADVRVRLTGPVAKAAWKDLSAYITNYSLVSGWRVKGLRLNQRMLTFRASRA